MNLGSYLNKYTEGGLAGHMAHPYDSPDLTFGELKDMIRTVSTGKAEKVTEKVDGQNIFFTYRNGEVRAARNNGDIKKGGMSLAEITNKFKGRGELEKAFVQGFLTIQDAVKKSQKVRNEFRANPGLWINCEIMYSKSPNVIQYSGNNLVLHGGKMFNEDENQAFNKIAQEFEKIQKANTGWSLHGPISTGFKVFDAKPYIGQINQIASDAGLSDEDTLGQLVINIIDKNETLKDMKDLKDFKQHVIEKSFHGRSEIKWPDMIENFSKSDAKKLRVVKNDIIEQGKKEALKGIADVIYNVGTKALQGINSKLIKKPLEEINRLREKTKALLGTKLTETQNEKVLRELSKLLNRNIKTVDDQVIADTIEKLDTATEGTVFSYKNHLYKMTGNFAGINQLLGIIQYGK